MITTIGAITIIYPLRNVVRLVALAWIFQAAGAYPPSSAAMPAPRRRFSHCGNKKARSLLAAVEFVEMLVPSVARPKAKAQKKDAARLVHRLMMAVGSQYRVP